MQTPASLPADQFSELLRRLPPDIDLDALARRTKAIERKRKVESGANLLRLALVRGPGGLSLSETAAWATMLGFAQMSDPGVKYRLDKAVGFLDAVLSGQLEAKSAGASVRWAGRILRAARACPRAVMSVFKGCGRRNPPRLVIPVASSDAGMRGGGRALSDG